MQWSDQGIVVASRTFGESKVLVTLLTRDHGRSAGLFRLSKHNRAWVQVGSLVKATWGGRLESQLGTWTLEPESTFTSRLLDRPGPLAALNSACALIHLLTPEGQECADVYASLFTLTQNLLEEEWCASYIRFERDLLSYLGYGLDTSRCAVTERTDDLVAISPRTGRAVCSEVAAPYGDKLLALPRFFLQNCEITLKDLKEGLQLTGFFLERHAMAPLKSGMPPARHRLLSLIHKPQEIAA